MRHRRTSAAQEPTREIHPGALSPVCKECHPGDHPVNHPGDLPGDQRERGISCGGNALRNTILLAIVTRLRRDREHGKQVVKHKPSHTPSMVWMAYRLGRSSGYFQSKVQLTKARPMKTLVSVACATRPGLHWLKMYGHRGAGAPCIWMP